MSSVVVKKSVASQLTSWDFWRERPHKRASEHRRNLNSSFFIDLYVNKYQDSVYLFLIMRFPS